jgi:beta-lactamase class A
MKKIVIILIVIVSVILNIFLLITLFSGKTQNKVPDASKELENKYPYLSQKILQDYDRDLLMNFIPLRAKLRDLVEKKYGSDFSFYFEYLPTGSSIGVNEKIEFYSASLLKVPLVMAYYHHREKNNIKNNPLVTITEKDINKKFGTLWEKGANSSVSLSEVIKFALIESDNTAANILEREIDVEDRQYIFNGLDILIKIEENNAASVTTKAYSSILKALFFSSLLTKDNSQYILDLLTKTKFEDKLPAGVPSDILVAHKIGVYENLEIPVYSDCGIVYVPKRQYILCMASKSDDKTAQDRMKTVSKIIYDFVSTANGIH